MRYVLLIILFAAIVTIGCDSKAPSTESTGSSKGPRMLKPGQEGSAPP